MRDQEREEVRNLARQIAELAASERMDKIRQRWRDANARRSGNRAPVYCRPIGCWPELLPEEFLVCTDPGLRRLEREFRKKLLKHEIGDDTIIEDKMGVAAVFRVTPENKWGLEPQRKHSGIDGGAWAYDPPLKSMRDLDALQLPRFQYDAEETDQRVNWLNDVLGDILPVSIYCGPLLGGTIGSHVADLRGLGQMMMDMMLEPEWLHRLTAHIRDAVLQAMADVAETGLLTPNNHGEMYCADPIGSPPASSRPYTYANCICAANSQEYDQVSPAFWEEFCLNYQLPIFEEFGAVAYGCCENLTQKINAVLRIPNLAIFVSSAWTDLDTAIDHIGDRHTIMWRQKASDVVLPDDTSGTRKHLDEGCRRLRDCHYQIVLRELQTLADHPNRLHEWTRLAIEAAERHV